MINQCLHQNNDTSLIVHIAIGTRLKIWRYVEQCIKQGDFDLERLCKISCIESYCALVLVLSW